MALRRVVAGASAGAMVLSSMWIARGAFTLGCR